MDKVLTRASRIADSLLVFIICLCLIVGWRSLVVPLILYLFRICMYGIFEVPISKILFKGEIKNG